MLTIQSADVRNFLVLILETPVYDITTYVMATLIVPMEEMKQTIYVV